MCPTRSPAWFLRLAEGDNFSRKWKGSVWDVLVGFFSGWVVLMVSMYLYLHFTFNIKIMHPKNHWILLWMGFDPKYFAGFWDLQATSDLRSHDS